MTPDFASFLIGLAAGLLIAWLARRDTVLILRGELDRSRTAEQVAADRLLAAWKEGAVVPPRPPAEPIKLLPLPEALQEEVNQWSDPEVRSEVEAKIRKLQDQGLDQASILLKLGEPAI